MMTVTPQALVRHYKKSCMTTIQVASMFDRTRQTCHYGVSDHRGYNRKVCIINEGEKDFLMSVWIFLMNNGVWN